MILQYLVNQYVLQRKETDTWRHPDRIPKSAISKRSNIREMIFQMVVYQRRKIKESSLCFTKVRVESSRFTLWKSTCPRINTLQERESTVDRESSLHLMREQNLTHEERRSSHSLPSQKRAEWSGVVTSCRRSWATRIHKMTSISHGRINKEFW